MPSMDYALAELSPFRKLPREALERLSGACRLQRYSHGEAVFSEGDPAGPVFLLKSGLLKAVKFSPHGEPVIMEIIVPGGLFGMIAVMDRKPYPVTAVSIRKSEVYRIAAEDFAELMARRPDFSREVFSEIGRHLRQSQDLRALAKESAEKRVAYVLWLMSSAMGRELPVLRSDVAEMAGTTPETAIRTLAALRRRKLLSSRWKRITVLNPARLKALSEPVR